MTLNSSMNYIIDLWKKYTDINYECVIIMIKDYRIIYLVRQII
jgi:hypothetical protein